MSGQIVAKDVSFAYPLTTSSESETIAGARLHNAWGTGGLTRYERASQARRDASGLLLNHVNLRISPTTRLGVVGENGSGKSTLLALLAGELEPVSGKITRHGSISLVTQELDLPAQARVGDLIAASLTEARQAVAAVEHTAEISPWLSEAPGGSPAHPALNQRDSTNELADLAIAVTRAEQLNAWDADRRLDEALTRFDAPRDPAKLLRELSVGEQYRVRLACVLAEQRDFLLLDEPTNHLDAAGVAYLTEQISKWPGGVVIVTHDRDFLQANATSIVDLDPSIDGKPVLYRGHSYDAYRRAKNRALARWEQAYLANQARQAELLALRDRTYEGLSDEWRPPKGSRPNRRATRARTHVKAADRAIAQLESEMAPVPPPPLQLHFPELPTDLPGPLIALQAPVIEGRLDMSNSEVELPPGGRLLVVGPNGSGKSTLLQALAGVLPLDAGSRWAASGLRIGIVAQENSELNLRHDDGAPMTGSDVLAADALRLLAEGALDPAHVNSVFDLGLLADADWERPVADYSVGMRRRLELARALMPAPHLLVLDEPTNHLSLDLVDSLTAALVQTPAAVIIATHDSRMRRDFANWDTITLPINVEG